MIANRGEVTRLAHHQHFFQFYIFLFEIGKNSAFGLFLTGFFSGTKVGLVFVSVFREVFGNGLVFYLYWFCNDVVAVFEGECLAVC